MERMAARVYCTVLLCLAGCWSSTEAGPGLNYTVVKPGVCPIQNFDGVCNMMRPIRCANDSDCADNQKCCSTTCGGRDCMTPVTAKPGVCPKTNAELVLCIRKDDELCADDSECPKNQKCCGTSCGGTRCTAPVTVKPGVCPKINSEIRCIRKDDELCADDSECPKNQKCCGTPCGGTQCTAPVTDVCRLPMDPGPCKVYLPMWGFDSAAGKCVSFVYGGCEGNDNRFNSQEECEESCGVRNDVCKLPMDPGPCEAYMPMWGFDSAAGKCVSFVYGGCQGNDNRFNSQEACEESCGVRNVNPGVCPRRKYELAMCARLTFMPCVDDGDCAKNEKCCSNGCGLQCMAAVTAKPGVCPIKKYKPAMCARIRFVTCADDSDCANKQKCCNNGCGLQCMDPVKVKPGVCPVRKSKPGMCPLMNFMSCVDDSDCANNEKCCNNGCGLDCMPPVTGPLPY